jgi:hypothetical protein
VDEVGWKNVGFFVRGVSLLPPKNDSLCLSGQARGKISAIESISTPTQTDTFALAALIIHNKTVVVTP